MQMHLFFPIIILLISLLSVNQAEACPRLHLQGVLVSADNREVTTRLSCLREDGSLAPAPPVSSYTLLVDSLAETQAMRTSTSKEPVDLVAIVQVSPVMEPALSDLKPALHRIAETLTEIPGSAVSLVTYADEPKRVVDLGDIATFVQALDSLTIITDAPESHLLRAIEHGYNLLKNRPLGRRKVLLVISDGVNADMSPTLARRDFREVEDRMRDAGIIVASVAYAPYDLGYLRYLEALTKATGGHWRLAVRPMQIESECKALSQELKHQQLVTFALPPEFTAERVQFQVTHQRGEKTSYSQPMHGNVPVRPGKLALARMAPEPSLGRWQTWGPFAGIFLSIGLFGLTHIRRPSRGRTTLSSEAVPNALNQARGKTATLHLGRRVLAGWVVKLDPTGAHETLVVSEIITLGPAQKQLQIAKCSDGFEMSVLDGSGERYRIEDGYRFHVGGESFKFKCVQRG